MSFSYPWAIVCLSHSLAADSILMKSLGLYLYLYLYIYIRPVCCDPINVNIAYTQRVPPIICINIFIIPADAATK